MFKIFKSARESVCVFCCLFRGMACSGWSGDDTDTGTERTQRASHQTSQIFAGFDPVTNALCCCLWKTKNSISLGGRDNILLRAVTLLYLCLGIKIWAQLTNSKLTNGSMQRLNFVESTLFFLVRSWFWRFNGKFTSLTTRSQRRKFLELKMVFAWVWE